MYYKMHQSHLFEIDETFPVNVPCRQKQFMITRAVRVRPLSDNEAFQDQTFSLKIYPYHPLYHIPLSKSQNELICGTKVIEGPETPEDLH